MLLYQYMSYFMIDLMSSDMFIPFLVAKVFHIVKKIKKCKEVIP